MQQFLLLEKVLEGKTIQFSKGRPLGRPLRIFAQTLLFPSCEEKI